MRLPVRIQVNKDVRGRIRHYTARLGDWTADGATKAEAETRLAAFIEKMASEDSSPLIRASSDGSGDVWMAMRYGGGDWGYGRWFQDTRPGFEGRFLSAGCSFGSKESVDKKLTVDLMDRHLESLRTGEPMRERSTALSQSVVDGLTAT